MTKKMRIDEINIKNFRLLKDATVSFSSSTTVIVGRNNSGKTSLTEIMSRLFSDKPAVFRLEDFSMCTHNDFWKAFALEKQGEDDSEIRKIIPTIQASITIHYPKDISEFGPLSDFIIDLNPTSETAVINISYKLGDGKVKTMFEGITLDGDEEKKKVTFYKAMKERVPKHFKAYLTAIDPNDPENTKTLEWSKLQQVLKAGFINAQRGLDDETYKDKDVLGKIVETLFSNANSEFASSGDKKTVLDLETFVGKMQADIDNSFNTKIKELIPALSVFGYPGFNDPGLHTETILDVKRLLSDNTKVRYIGTHGVSLPEAFNGLGARNLVFILLKLLEFFKLYKACPTSPSVYLIFIEEPEAHLHPQMQEVFIRQLGKVVGMFSNTYNEGKVWPVQFVISTHSSHIANEAPFTDIRYFISKPEKPGTTFFETKIKDLGTGLTTTDSAGIKFLHKYMTLTRCDLFFADKAILIEGATERLLLPKMIEMLDNFPSDKQTKLSAQYYSIIEVGGSYAHLFNELLDFLEIKTLIITDIDTVKDPGGIACKVSEGTITSNTCIKDWFKSTNGGSISTGDLLRKSVEHKIRKSRFLAYQKSEKDGEPCGRSFEASFMLANKEIFGLDKVKEIDMEEHVWRESEKLKNKKTDLAIKYAIEETSWNIPLYIKEGLSWLSEDVAPLNDTKPEKTPTSLIKAKSKIIRKK